jgi:hypothetical protein
MVVAVQDQSSLGRDGKPEKLKTKEIKLMSFWKEQTRAGFASVSASGVDVVSHRLIDEPAVVLYKGREGGRG